MSLLDAPVLAHVVRGGVIESVHRGIAVVTDPGGAVAQAWGDPGTAVFPRSSSKPIQAVAALRAGADLAGASLALACASHSGEDAHLDGVRSMLARAGLSEADLDNTPMRPLGEAPLAAWFAAGRPPASIAQNCSGKHAGMLIACRAAGWPTAGYRDPGHPLQRLIADTIEDLAGETISAVVTDGCGAPAHRIPLAGLARAFGRLAAAASGSERRVADAMRTHPWFVGGTGRPDTGIMTDVPGLIAKEGAEAVFALGLPDGRGIAVKIADGARAGRVVAGAVLAWLGVDPDAAARLGTVPVLGHGVPVGSVVAVL
ncbi:MAG: asparaginase [Propioniciclava sp.]|uniref:asparaginase n=1 Tax=Propioniciclava sp. TaxID=2038686 RepID=UPI0039E3196D